MSTSDLVSTTWLADHLKDPAVRCVDVRWYMGDSTRRGIDEYLRGHIPGAAFLDIDTELASAPYSGPGCLPMPKAADFTRAVGGAGISPETYVVCYDDTGGTSAARLWWLLRFFGHPRVAMLDGGIVQWASEGRPLQAGVEKIPPATFVANPQRGWTVDKKELNVLRHSRLALVLDSRKRERYLGEAVLAPIDARAGHIPGAKSAPCLDNLVGSTDLRFRPAAELRARFESLGADENKQIVSYCGCGINGCLNLFALRLAGYRNLVLYEGSWSDWSRDETLPVAVGPEPG